MIQWEEVELMDATHIEINGEVHEITEIRRWHGYKIYESWIDILIEENKWANIPQEAFPLLGIRCLRKFKPTPIEFEATFVMYDGCWQTLHSLEDRFPDNCKKATFRCVEILEDEE
jgi:hypothetical protein